MGEGNDRPHRQCKQHSRLSQTIKQYSWAQRFAVLGDVWRLNRHEGVGVGEDVVNARTQQKRTLESTCNFIDIVVTHLLGSKCSNTYRLLHP